MQSSTKQALLDLLDELYEARGEVALARVQENLSTAELRVLEGEFDSRFKRILNQLENIVALS